MKSNYFRPWFTETSFKKEVSVRAALLWVSVRVKFKNFFLRIRG